MTFDREFRLAELIADLPKDKLQGALAALLGDFALTDSRGTVLLGTAQPGTGAPISLEIEPIGRLTAPAAAPERVGAAAILLKALLRIQARYRMAHDLHQETVRADYAALLDKHAALMESENRYKALAESLEDRVRQQVQTIDDQQRQLYQAEKLASVGRLAAGVAHEINNPIGFLRSNLSTAQAYVERLARLAPAVQAGDAGAIQATWQAIEGGYLLEDFADLLRESLTGADRVARIVADLKGFSSVDRTEEEMADLNESLRTACSVIAGQVPPDVAIRQDLQPLPRILCLPGHISQAVMNLLSNAVEAVGARGEIQVSSAVADGHILIRVRDSGPGIPPDILGRIFDPFFTTREVGKGTGLGLTVAKDVAEAHGGRIEVENAPGGGAAFTLRLPI